MALYKLVFNFNFMLLLSFFSGESLFLQITAKELKYKASKMWNQLPSSLKEFLSVKYFSNKLKEFLQAVDTDNTF